MLLRVGVAMMAFAVLFAAGVAAMAAFQREPAPELVSSSPSAVAKTAITEIPEREEQPRSLLAEGNLQGERERPEPPLRQQAADTALVAEAEDWPAPTKAELNDAAGPRYYDPSSGAFSLSIPDLGVYGAPVFDSKSQADLDRGLIHLPETPMPWDQEGQKNVYIAGHRIGYPGTESHLIFYHLDKLRDGDRIVLQDRSGREYIYRVTETFVVDPWASWAVDPVRGRDTVTLQTCTPIPTFENRLIVRADRVRATSFG